jgi:hypothetical protein
MARPLNTARLGGLNPSLSYNVSFPLCHFYIDWSQGASRSWIHIFLVCGARRFYEGHSWERVRIGSRLGALMGYVARWGLFWCWKTGCCEWCLVRLDRGHFLPCRGRLVLS